MESTREPKIYLFDLAFFVWYPGYLWRKHLLLRLGVCVSLFLAVASITAIGLVSYSYYRRAGELDIASVSRFSDGGVVLDASGNVVGSLNPTGRFLLGVNEVPQVFRDALIAAEDGSFYEHRGFDPEAILRAALANFRGGEVVQGGSTITQQLARNSAELGGRTLDRKLLELFFAFRIEQHYSKKEIMAHYANRVYFGSGYNGLGAASYGYFGKEPSELTVGEAATLAGLIRSPNRLSPFNSIERSLAARDGVLHRMVKEKMISGKEAEVAMAETLVLPKGRAKRGRPLFLLTAVKRELEDELGFGGMDDIIVETSIDLSVQRDAETVLASHLQALETKAGIGFPHQTQADFRNGKENAPAYLQGALVVIENATGRIITSIASRDHLESHYDRVSLMKRPAGFVFAPFVYAAAYDSGKASPASTVYDVPMNNREVMLGGQSGILGEWSAESLRNRYLGAVPAGYALLSGKNAATVRLGFETGLDEVEATARLAGIESELKGYPSTFLGASEVSLVEMAHAYTVFPNLGRRSVKAGLVDRVLTKDGTVLYDRSREWGNSVSAISDSAAALVGRTLKQAVDLKAGPATRKVLSGVTGETGGMGGTSHGFEDNWFIGFNSKYTWGVWIGLDKPQPIYDRAFSRDTAMPVWAELAESLDTAAPLPGSALVRTAHLCLHSGKPGHEGCLKAGHKLCAIPVASGFALDGYCGGSRSLAKPPSQAMQAQPVSLTSSGRVIGGAGAVVRPGIEPLIGGDAYGALGEPTEERGVGNSGRRD